MWIFTPVLRLGNQQIIVETIQLLRSLRSFCQLNRLLRKNYRNVFVFLLGVYLAYSFNHKNGTACSASRNRRGCWERDFIFFPGTIMQSLYTLHQNLETPAVNCLRLVVFRGGLHSSCEALLSIPRLWNGPFHGLTPCCRQSASSLTEDENKPFDGYLALDFVCTACVALSLSMAYSKVFYRPNRRATFLYESILTTRSHVVVISVQKRSSWVSTIYLLIMVPPIVPS